MTFLPEMMKQNHCFATLGVCVSRMCVAAIICCILHYLYLATRKKHARAPRFARLRVLFLKGHWELCIMSSYN